MADSELISLSLRTRRFAIRVLKLVDSLPKSASGRALASQLARSSMSVAANYRASQMARSKKEFVAKLGVVLEEADETYFWLELVIEAQMLPVKRVEKLKDESRELVAIFVTAVKNAKLSSGRGTTEDQAES